MSLVKDDDCIFEIERTSLKQTPFKKIVKRENSQLRFLCELFRIEVRTGKLFATKIFELVQIHCYFRSFWIGHLSIWT